jgi:hypothetical protein
MPWRLISSLRVSAPSTVALSTSRCCARFPGTAPGRHFARTDLQHYATRIMSSTIVPSVFTRNAESPAAAGPRGGRREIPVVSARSAPLSPTRLTSVRLRHDSLMAAVRGFKNCVIQRLAPTTMPLRLLSNYMERLRQEGPTADLVLAHRVACHLVDLVATALESARVNDRHGGIPELTHCAVTDEQSIPF